MQSRLGNKRELINGAAGGTAIVPTGARPGPLPGTVGTELPGTRRWRPGDVPGRDLMAGEWRPGVLHPGVLYSDSTTRGFRVTTEAGGVKRPRVQVQMVLPAVPVLLLPELSCHRENSGSHQFTWPHHPAATSIPQLRTQQWDLQPC